MEKINWTIDPAHSEIGFKVKHLMISTVTGQFKRFTASATTDTETFTHAAGIEFTAEVDSLDTRNEQRDNHLKSADFFDAANFTQIKFVASGFKNNGSNSLLNGDLTIKGITKPVSFEVEFGGIVVDPYGQTKAGFSLSGKINRKQFGLSWDALTEAGSVVVGEEVRFSGNIQLVKQA